MFLNKTKVNAKINEIMSILYNEHLISDENMQFISDHIGRFNYSQLYDINSYNQKQNRSDHYFIIYKRLVRIFLEKEIDRRKPNAKTQYRRKR